MANEHEEFLNSAESMFRGVAKRAWPGVVAVVVAQIVLSALGLALTGGIFYGIFLLIQQSLG